MKTVREGKGKKESKLSLVNYVYKLTDGDWAKYRRLKKLILKVKEILKKDEKQYPDYIEEIENLKDKILNIRIGNKYFFKYELEVSQLMILYVGIFWKTILLNSFKSHRERILRNKRIQGYEIKIKDLDLELKEIDLQRKNIESALKDISLSEKELELEEVRIDIEIKDESIDYLHENFVNKGKWKHLKPEIEALFVKGFSQKEAIKHLVEIQEDDIIKNELSKNGNNHKKLFQNIERSLYSRKN